MDKNIIFKNNDLEKYIRFKLDKDDNNFTSKELEEIREVVFEYNDSSDNMILLEELLYLPNLEIVTIRYGYILNVDFSILLKLNCLDEVIFDNCEFENADLIASLNLRSLSLINCEIKTYSFINLLERIKELTIINGKVDIKHLNKLDKLEYLQLSYSEIIDDGELSISTIKELYIDNTNIHNFYFLDKLKNLKRLSIDKNQYNSNKDLFKSLIERNIYVLNENMAVFGGDVDDEV